MGETCSWKVENRINETVFSMDKEVERLEEIFFNCSFDNEFNDVTKDQWQKVVSPSSSLSSIGSSDDDFVYTPKSPVKSRQSPNTSIEESVSLDEINAQIGIAEEYSQSPARRSEKKSLLETIFEGKFLHTPPKKDQKDTQQHVLDRLERN